MNGIHYPFSRNQKKVLLGLAQGLRNEDLASQHGVALNGIHTHMYRIKKIICTEGPRAMVVFAVRWADAQKGQQ